MIKLYVAVLDDPITHMGGFALHPDGDRWDELFASYQEYANHYARLCEELGIEILCLGTELESMTHEDPAGLQDPDRRWRALIAEVRGIYAGKLTYSCALGGSWNRPWSSPQGVTFWDALDYIGFELYQGLSNTSNPTLEQLKEALCSDFTEHVEPLVEKYDRPILIPEIGPQNCDGSNMSPYSPFSPPSDRLDLDEQAMYYETVLQVIEEISARKDYFAGVYWWNGQLIYPWVNLTMDPDEEGCGGTQIWGSPSEEAIRSHWTRANGWAECEPCISPAVIPEAARKDGCSVGVLTSDASDLTIVEGKTAPGWLFSHWEGSVTHAGYPLAATSESLAGVSAVFVPAPCTPVSVDETLDLRRIDGLIHMAGDLDAFWFAGGGEGKVDTEWRDGVEILVYDYPGSDNAKVALRFSVPFDASSYDGVQFTIRAEQTIGISVAIASRDVGLQGQLNADDWKSSSLWSECLIRALPSEQTFRVPFFLFRDHPWIIEEFPDVTWHANADALWEIEFYPSGSLCRIDILEVAFYRTSPDE